jgi:hypothetical protein
MLRCSEFRPEGAEQISPGQRPGNGNFRGKQALKGRNKGLASCALTGTGECVAMVPGRCPGLICGCPFGANPRGLHVKSADFSMTLRNFGTLRCGRPIVVFRGAKGDFGLASRQQRNIKTRQRGAVGSGHTRKIHPRRPSLARRVGRVRPGRVSTCLLSTHYSQRTMRL